MELKTFRIKEEQLEVLRKLSKDRGIPQSLLMRMAIDDLFKVDPIVKTRICHI